MKELINLLEFSSPVWNPISQSNINTLSSVQRFFTNRIPSCTFLPYKRRLEILALDSLQKRRLIADLVCMFSIVNGTSNTSLYPYLTFVDPSVTRSHNLRIHRPTFNLASSHQNFISRSCPSWNKLPASILASSSKRIFRKKTCYFS